MSKAITEKHDDPGPGRRWQPAIESAPSMVRADEPTVARTIGLIGASCVIFGGIALLLNLIGHSERVGIGMASIILAIGVVGLLSHAAYDRELQVRRLYWGCGLALLAVGILLCLIPFDGNTGGLFGIGYPCLGLALMFLLATQHHETDPAIQNFTRLILGGAGAVGAAVGFLQSNFLDVGFLVPYGAMAAVMGLAYLTAFISQIGLADDRGYKAALGMGAVGLFAIFLGLLRTIIQAEPMNMPLVPWGLMYISLGLLYLGISIGACSDWPLVVLMRRELSAYFFSPLVYLLLVSLAFVAWISYSDFLSIVVQFKMPEPIIGFFLWGLWPILTVTFIVPVLTMRLLSEEKRTGSLEVLLTAPVNESTVVLGKFLAAFLLFMLMWSPWWLFLVSLRVGGGVPFDYRPLFSFLVVLSLTGASFIAMGLFFSSLTRNQVASAVLTFAGMMLFLGLYLLKSSLERENPNGNLLMVVKHVDYVDLWKRALDGILIPKYLLFHISATIIWLFLTIKVLEARRWA